MPGNPWQNQNPEWETTTRTFTYDGDGQMTKCEESKGQFDKATYTYTYDEAGNRTLAKKAKLYSYLESWQNTYTYNDDNQMVAATVCEGNLTKKYTFTYDEADNLSGILYPDGYSVLYEYDKNDNITKLTDSDGRETTYGYDPLNRLTGVARPDGSLSTYTYNARNQVLEAKNTCICGALISSYQYTYDDGGLIIKEVAKENLFTSEKDYGHTGGASDRCMHKTDNPWMNQNPEWETTVRDFTYDDNGQMTGCKESRGAVRQGDLYLCLR